MYSGPFDGSPVNTYIHGVTGILGTNEGKLTMALFLNLEIKLKPWFLRMTKLPLGCLS